MSALFLARDFVYCVAEQPCGPNITRKTQFTADVISACAGSDKLLYYIPASEPQTMRSWDTKNNASANDSTRIGQISGPHSLSKVLFHNNKVYAIATPSDCLYAYDPLNKIVESIHVGIPVADFQPASHGFVFKDTTGTFFGYHFTQGLTPVAGCDGGELLGHYKRFAVAWQPAKNEAVAIAETGAIVRSGFPPVRRPFVTIEDKAVELDVTGLFYNHRRVPLPSDVTTIKQLMPIPQMDDETVCTLCFCEFEDEVGVTFDCGHQFHLDCINQWARRWDEFKTKGTHVVFTNAVCPGGCKHLMRHPAVPQTTDIIALYKETTAKATSVIQTLGSNKAVDDILFYMCSRCGHPFCGGERVCFRMQGQEPQKDPKDLICDDCCDDFHCEKHGRQFVVYKCQYCCNPATQRSFGTRYLCDRCNALWEGSAEPDSTPCPGAAMCPFNGHHIGDAKPPVPMGCQACMGPDALVYERIVQPPPPTSPTDGK